MEIIFEYEKNSFENIVDIVVMEDVRAQEIDMSTSNRSPFIK